MGYCYEVINKAGKSRIVRCGNKGTLPRKGGKMKELKTSIKEILEKTYPRQAVYYKPEFIGATCLMGQDAITAWAEQTAQEIIKEIIEHGKK